MIKLPLLLLAALLLLPATASAAGPVALPVDATPLPREASLAGFRYLVFETGKARAGQLLPLIVGLHYSSAKPEAMLAYFDQIEFPARILLPQGAYPRRAGYSWFPTDYAQLPVAEQTAATLRAGASLLAFIDAAVGKTM